MLSSINGIDSLARETIRKKTVLSLPDNPSEQGYTAGQIKEAITAPLLDSEGSLIAHINRIVAEINAHLEEIDEELNHA